MKVKGFGNLPNGNMYSEWYGEVEPKIARFIRKNNVSPADFESLQDGWFSYFSAELLDAYLLATG